VYGVAKLGDILLGDLIQGNNQTNRLFVPLDDF
jgi:hypothetical protein